jgi:two-component system response regulator RegA
MPARILFVDDETPMLQLLSEFFRQKGCLVKTAASGRQAMLLAEMETFDFAVLDINIAGENGLQLLSYFKQYFPTLPIVMLTGLSPVEELIDQARLRGASGFLRKTDPLDDIFSSLRVYMPEG